MRLPPLNALRAFEAAARHGGYIAAADELNVTRGAVSRHVKVLEDHLGVALFHRQSRGVALTEAGRRLLPVLTNAFHQIVEGSARVAAAEADLRILCPPATSIRWLLPRLPEFRARHPEIRVQVTTDFFARSGYDASQYTLAFSVDVHHRRGPDTMVQPLAPLLLAPACAPEMVSCLKTPEDLKDVTLLHENPMRSDWRHWLATHPTPGVDAETGDVFQNLDMAIKAAELGAGVVMLDFLLCRNELAQGSLVLPFPDMTIRPPERRFCLLGNRASWTDPAVLAFRTWFGAVSEADTRAVFGDRTM